MILEGQKLVDTLNSKCKGAKKRIWIASPFIGNLKDVKRIIGDVWMQPDIDFRILTDALHGFVKKDTFETVKSLSCIRSLDSIHAKIYIVDDWCLITSANLTRTAFSKRYEIGTVVEESDFENVESVYNEWWDIAIPANRKVSSAQSKNYEEGAGLKEKWKLPKYTESKTNTYLLSCKMYKEFAAIYEEVTGRNQAMVNDGFTIYQEVDFFFNYLYHHHPDTPSNKLKKCRIINDEKRRDEIRKYFKEMEYDSKCNKYRVIKSKNIRKILSPQRIDDITLEDVDEVINSLHCYDSYKWNKKFFLEKNKIDEIKYTWRNLLHTDSISSDKIDKAVKELRYWGQASAKELIGWYYPRKYPIMNRNSDSGMRFFGYDIK